MTAAVSVYWQAGYFGFFQVDDPNYITQNPYVKEGFSLKGLAWAFTTSHAANWHPLTWLSHMSDVALYGLNPGAHHLTNLLFHSLNTLLLFSALRKLTGELWRSAFVALLFAVHPLHVESVVWVSERKDVLCAFFGFLTILSYTGFVRRGGWARYGLTLVLFILGLMSKPMLVTWPFVLLILDFWPLGRFRFSDGFRFADLYKNIGLFWEKAPFFGLSAVACLVTVIAQKAGGAVQNLSWLPFGVRIENMLAAYVSYLVKTIWPAQLAYMYPYPDHFPLWQTAGAFLLLGLITFLALRSVGSRPYLAAGWFWYLGTLIPVIGIVQVGVQPMADRYIYIPLVGIFIMIAWGIPDLMRHWRYKQVVLAASGLVVLVLLMVKTYGQVQYWQDTATLFRHTLRVTEKNYVIHFDLANTLERENRFDEAMEHYRAALEIKPELPAAHNALGEGLRRKKQFDQAIAHYREAIRMDPNYAEAYNNLGVAHLMQGRRHEAVRCFQEALRIKPDYSSPRRNLQKINRNGTVR